MNSSLTGSSGPGGLGLWMTALIVGGIGLVFFLFTRRRRRDELEPDASIAAAIASAGAAAAAAPDTGSGAKAGGGRRGKVGAGSRGKTAVTGAAAAAAGGKAATTGGKTAAAAKVVAPEPLPVVPPPPAPNRIVAAAAGAEILDEEAGMPRWRRPSVQKARKESRGGEVAYVPAAFTAGEPVGERRRVRYRLVRMSSIPDEIMGDEVARLDRGDEVELIRSAGSYWLVRTPFGDEGWVHQMTLESGPPQPDDEPTDVSDDAPF